MCLGDEQVTQHCRVLDTDAFDIVIGTDFLRRNPQMKLLSLQRPYPPPPSGDEFVEVEKKILGLNSVAPQENF